MFCSNCGSAIPVGAEFCANCGKPAREESKINVSKATIRSLVAMILGIMGTIVGLAITIFSTIFLADGSAAFYGFGLVALVLAAAFTFVSSSFALACSIKARKNGDKSALSATGIAFGCIGILLGLVALIFIIIIACRPSDMIGEQVHALQQKNISWSDMYTKMQQARSQNANAILVFPLS